MGQQKHTSGNKDSRIEENSMDNTVFETINYLRWSNYAMK